MEGRGTDVFEGLSYTASFLSSGDLADLENAVSLLLPIFDLDYLHLVPESEQVCHLPGLSEDLVKNVHPQPLMAQFDKECANSFPPRIPFESSSPKKPHTPTLFCLYFGI